MQQFNFKNNILNLKVKKSPLAIRIIMFFLSFTFFVFPVVGTIIGLANGHGLNIGYFFVIGIFALLGFYLLRISLWNTYGDETIQILENKIMYEANYGWFKDGKKEIAISDPKYSFKSVGYEEDNECALVISSENSQIESVVKMPVEEMETLLLILEPAKIDSN